MKKATRVWLVVAGILILLGCMLFAGVMGMLNWDFMKLSTVQYETNTYAFSEDFDSIIMNTSTADIVFVLSDDGKCRVECRETEKEKHTVTVENGELTVTSQDDSSLSDWIGSVGINIGSPKITVYLPKTQYSSLHIQEATGAVKMPEDFKFGDVNIAVSTGAVDFCASASGTIAIRASTGSIRVEDITADALTLSVSTGKVTATGVNCEGDVTVGVSTGEAILTDVVCNTLTSKGNTGDISLSHVVVAQKLSVKRSTGDVKLENSDAAELSIETDTGDVTGTLLSDKVFVVETDTGSIDVPKTTSGGSCEITTDTGDIRIKIEKPEF